MAIVKEFFETREDGVNLYRTYSNEGFKILQVETGNVYDEAIDIENANYTYQETEEKIGDLIEEKTNEDEATEKDYLEALERLGVYE